MFTIPPEYFRKYNNIFTSAGYVHGSAEKKHYVINKYR